MNERITKILSDPKMVVAGASLLSFGVGAGVGYILGKRRRTVVYSSGPDLEFDFDTSNLMKETGDFKIDEPGLVEETKFVVDEKVKELKDIQFRDLRIDPNGVGEIVSVKDVPEEATDDEVEEEVEVVTNNVFAASEDGWDYEEEIRGRNSTEPYVIHRDEFFEDDDEFDYRQASLTYYEGDEILVDDQNAPVYNFENAIGPLRFGHGSGEENIFYVRNPKLRMDYEIIRNPGHYSVEVLGLEIEDDAQEADLRHSAPRFRQE